MKRPIINALILTIGIIIAAGWAGALAGVFVFFFFRTLRFLVSL